MLVVNLYGQPGAGKSTGAAYVFSKLKLDGFNVELLTEFAKDCVWQEQYTAFNNSAYLFGTQLYKLKSVYNKVDCVITDSPILLSILYNAENDFVKSVHFEELVLDYYNYFNNLNFLIKRVKEYNPVGRNQTEEESVLLSLKIEELLNTNYIPHTIVEGNVSGYDIIYEKVNKILKSTR